MANKSLHKAKNAKKDEFYTQYSDIQREVNAYLEYNPDVFRDKVILLPCDDPEWSNFTKFFAQNFERFGIKKLISTSYAIDLKRKKYGLLYQLSLFETESPQFNEEKATTNGKLFVLDKDNNKSGKIDIDDLKWDYLDGDGDFRSDEVKKLRDEADVIITNPPFSLFKEFITWLFETKKEFLIIGSQNNITYKNVFSLMQHNKMWLGYNSGSQEFQVPDDFERNNTYIASDGKKYAKFGNMCWFTNLDHGRRKHPLQLMTMEDNKKFSKHEKIKGKEYEKYLNYDAIEVPFTDAIPKDYKGVMGVPVSFLEKYNPQQFKIIGCADANIVPEGWKGMTQEFVDLYYEQGNTGTYKEGNRLACYINYQGKAIVPYKRILIELIMEDKNENDIKD